LERRVASSEKKARRLNVKRGVREAEKEAVKARENA
jgi:hypothetical protein